MADFGLLFDTITDPWFESEPSRIVWFTKLLRAVDADGVVKMSRAKFGKLFNCTAKAAYYFLVCLEKRGVITLAIDASNTKVEVLNFTDYEAVGRNLGAIWAQNSREEKSKEKRKEKVLSPTPPIIKEKIKEKKEEERSLPLRYAPDFVGDVSDTNKKELEKQRKAEERKARTAERKQKEATLVHKARLIFEAYYNEIYEDSYYWSAKDAVAMRRLLKKISFGRTNRQTPLPCDDDSLLDALKVFLRMINKSWIMNNFSVTKIDSQYNDIVSEIKNKNNSAYGKRNQTQQATATAMLANQAANLLNDIAKADELYYRGDQGGDDIAEGDEAI